jgi:hypothetical protein
MMKMVQNIVSIALPLMVGMASACASPGIREERELMHATRQQEKAMQRDELQMQRQEERRRETAAMQQNNPANVVPDSSRRPGRMTPEERRALRRQINEAGQDIYAPKR